MDRDKRWDRVAKAYQALTAAIGEHADDPIKAVEAAYARGETDEFVLPTAIADYPGMRDGDGVFFANFRADRIREIAAALFDPDFSGFECEKRVTFAESRPLPSYLVAFVVGPFDLVDGGPIGRNHVPLHFIIPHGRGAETAIKPWGVVLSLIVVGILLFTGWKGWEMVYRHRVGVADY